MIRVRKLIFVGAWALVCVLGTLSAPALAAESCPNEQLRSESAPNPATGVPFSLQLPECRAYEMVSPPLKNGSPVTALISLGAESLSSVSRVGSEGDTVLITSTGIWPGAEQPPSNNLIDTDAAESERYRVTRGASGWEFKPEEPPVGDLRDFKGALLPNPTDLGGELSTSGIWQGAGFLPSEAHIAIGDDPNFYLLDPAGALVEIGPSVPLADQAFERPVLGSVEAVGASADLSHMLFSVSDWRWPFDQTKLSATDGFELLSLYEYIGTGHSGEGGDVPTLVGVDNTGALIGECGVKAGGYAYATGKGNERADETGEVEARSISAGGSTVFFTVLTPESYCQGGTAPAVNEVFARVGEPGPEAKVGSAVTVNVAGADDSACETATFDSCGVTRAVEYQGASTDGSKVFFSSEQPLVSGDTDTTNNLYECVLPGDSGAALTPISPVNPCPDLVRVSVPVSGAAEVQSVAAVSRDGSHVYFVAKGELAGPNAEGKSPMPGEDNLYVWAQGRTAFIARLSAAAFKLGEAQATPDGEQLVFTSAADIAPGDTGSVAQIFLYEAAHEALTWVSEGQGGAEDGNTTTDPASLESFPINTNETQPAEGRRVISEDGSVVVFQSSAALTAEVHGGTHNVYLWRGGELHLISDGTPAGTVGHTEGAGKAGLVGIDASGQNVFFTTEAPLVAQDTDVLSDLYDARVDGGFPAPRVEECAGEACQGALSAPPAPLLLGSLSAGAQGDLTPAPSVKTTVVTKPPLTRAQKLAKALKACAKKRAKKRRAKCEAAARRRYGAKAKAKRKAQRRPGKAASEGGR